MEILNGHCGIGWLRCGNTVATTVEGTARIRMQADNSQFQCFRGNVRVRPEDAVNGLEAFPGSMTGHAIVTELF